MDSPFGKRLFKLFLVFSLVPAVFIAAAGYYLASEQSLSSTSFEGADVTAFASYYNDYLFDLISRSVTEVTAGTSFSDTPLDFVIPVRDDVGSIGSFYSPRLLTEDFPKERILLASQDKNQGFVEWQGQYYQYRLIELDGGAIVAGYIHDESYAEMLSLAQADQASASSRRTLAPNYLYFLAILFAVLAALTAGLAYYFAFRISRSLASPLSQLSTASQRIAEGDFDQQVRTGGVGEVALLIDNFNQMAKQLKTITARLAQTERVAAWRSVARRFAHELKNPLQPILVSLYRLERGLKESDQYEQMIEPLRAASEELKHLTELADRFSQLAKLPEPKLQPTRLKELLASISALYSEQLADYRFQVETPDEEITANIDPTYFREALHNLILNAADASEKGSSIILRLAQEAGSVRVELQDFGCGMSRETVSSARIPYFSTKEKGTGLGLAVVEKIISELGGSVNIDSVEGAGTTVSLVLPAVDKQNGKDSNS